MHALRSRTSRLLIAVALAATLSTSAPTAQIALSLETGNTWNAGSSQTYSTLPPGTPIAAAPFFFHGYAISNASAQHIVTVQETGDELRCNHSGSTSPSSPFGPTVGLPLRVLRATLSSPVPVYADIELGASHGAQFLGLSTRATIELVGSTHVLDSGPPAFMGSSVSDRITVRIGPEGIEFLMSIQFFERNASTSFTVDLTTVTPAPTVAISAVGTGCGPTLQGAVFPDADRLASLRIDVAGAPDWPAPFLLLGVTDIAFPIPPTGCLLLTNILASPALPAPIAGESSLALPVPIGAMGLDVRLQYLIGRSAPSGGGALEWQTSNALRIQIP